jgi:hypothetical protein
MTRPDTIRLTIEYTGKEPFHEEVHGNPTFQELKLKAMKAFDLEQSAANEYVLQFEGTDLDEKRHVDSLCGADVTLQLTLKHEPVKGSRS